PAFVDVAVLVGDALGRDLEIGMGGVRLEVAVDDRKLRAAAAATRRRAQVRAEIGAEVRRVVAARATDHAAARPDVQVRAAVGPAIAAVAPTIAVRATRSGGRRTSRTRQR